MKRRAFVKLLAGAAMTTPFSAFARAATNHRLGARPDRHRGRAFVAR